MGGGVVLSERQSARIAISVSHGCLTANFRDYTLSRLLAPNSSGIHLPTLFVLDLATKGIFPCMNEHSILQFIAQDLENTLEMKNPKKEKMTGE